MSNYNPSIYYVLGECHIIDEIDPETGLTKYGGHTKGEVLARYPQAVELSWEEVEPLIDEAANKKFCSRPQRINAERWEEMLNVLPPKRWMQDGEGESFKFMEMTWGDLGLIFCRLGEDYWEFTDSHSLTHEQICQKCREQGQRNKDWLDAKFEEAQAGML
jgi:hypothetical protein